MHWMREREIHGADISKPLSRVTRAKRIVNSY